VNENVNEYWLYDGCFFFWHINLSKYGVRYLPSVEMERGFTSKSGAGDAGVVFYD
jgi:hypothetical protein